MHINEELQLLIKSKYPLIYLETVDEQHSIQQLKDIAKELNYDYFTWSITEGLKKGNNLNSYYKTNDPAKVFITILELLKPDPYLPELPKLFILFDLEKYLEDPGILRFLKDGINAVSNTPHKIVIVASTFKLPGEIQNSSAHIIGGYPEEKEIFMIIKETVQESNISGRKIIVNLIDVEIKKMISALKGLSIQQIRNVVSQCINDDAILNINDLNIIEKYKKKLFDQEGMLEFCVTEAKESLGGFNNLKRWLSDRKNCFGAAQNTSLPSPKGVLLMGVQGCGKSLAVKTVARELSLPLYRLDIGRLYSKYIGETEENLRRVLSIVEKLSPVCLWIDEIEKGFASSTGTEDGGVSQRVLGTFLTWMQEKTAECFIAATANNISRLPPEFLRKGRFDEVFFVDLPDAEERRTIFTLLLKKRELKPENFDLELLANRSDGFSGAEIEQVIISALYRASNENNPVGTSHIIEQIDSTKPLSVIRAEDISALREWAKERTIPA